MNKNKVSVIIPFYTNVNWLREAINSVLQQSYKNFEIIVINDGSKEDMTCFLKEYSKKIIYVEEKNKGAAAARNKGIDVASGKYIAFLDSDDIWEKEKLEKQVEYMEANKLVWSHTSYSIFGEIAKSKNIDVSYFKGMTFPLSIISNPIATPCVMIRSSEIKNDKELRFNEKMKSGEDTFLWVKISIKYRLGIINESLTKVRIRGSNAALLAYSQIRARAQIWEEIENSEFRNNLCNLDFSIKFAYKYCYILYKIINIFEVKNTRKVFDFVCKILYLLPWIIFKLNKRKYT